MGKIAVVHTSFRTKIVEGDDAQVDERYATCKASHVVSAMEKKDYYLTMGIKVI